MDRVDWVHIYAMMMHDIIMQIYILSNYSGFKVLKGQGI